MKIKLLLNDKIRELLEEISPILKEISGVNIEICDGLAFISGQNAVYVEKTLLSLEKAKRVLPEELSAVYQMYREEPYKSNLSGLSKMIAPRCKSQRRYLNLLESKDIVFAAGPAGTGKTHIAIAYGLNSLLTKTVRKLVLSRPAVEAGEKLGFLPGDLKEKLDPYLLPLYDELSNWIPYHMIDKMITDHKIEIAPFAYMRGRTLQNACIVVDEAQNTTVTQMKMLLTRIGDGSTMIITGDESQVDLPARVRSGFMDAIHRLEDISQIGFIRFTNESIVRHKVIGEILKRYNSEVKENREMSREYRAVAQAEEVDARDKEYFHENYEF